MARLIDGQNNNDEQTSSITANDNNFKDVDMKNDNSNVKTSATVVPKKSNSISYKVRQQFPASHVSGCTSYKARRIYVSESTVARLASKFNTAGLNITQGSDNRSYHSSFNKKYPEKKSITIRNSSVLETIKFFEKDAARKSTKKVSDLNAQHADETKGELTSGNAALEGEFKRRTDDGYTSAAKKETSAKPSVQPKPIVLLQTVAAGKENRVCGMTGKKSALIRSKVNVDGRVESKNFENSHYHAPKLFAKNDKIMSTDYQVVSSRNKRLSIAKDFSLESVLNDDLRNDISKETPKNEDTATTRNKKANPSFLHTYVRLSSESNETVPENSLTNESPCVDLQARQLPPSPVPDTMNSKNSSALHDSLVKTLNRLRNDSSNGIYEDLMVLKENCDTEKNSIDHHYSDINEIRKDNFEPYDDVIYAELYNNDDVENYETVSSDRTDQKDEHSAPSDEGIRRSDSESSFEQTNSIYELKPTSDFSSATTSTFSSSNDCINIKIESPYVYVADTKSSASDVSNDEVNTDDWDSDENEPKKIIVYTKQVNRFRKFKKRKLKFILPSKREFKDNVETVQEKDTSFMDELCDDFDDSSSDVDSSEMNGRIEAVNQLNKNQSTHNSHPQNIYGLVEKARKTVRKSWSSLNQIRKMSVSNISNNFPLKVQEIPTNRSKSVSVEEINGHSSSSGGSVRWTSFKSKFRPRYSTLTHSSSSVFYLNPEDLCFDKSETVRKQNNSNNRRRRMTCIELGPTRPTSPPPPPPIHKNKSSETRSSINSSSNVYSDPSNSSYGSRNSLNGTETPCDSNSSRGSDLQLGLRFADEPLYQFYAESVAKLTNDASMDCLTDSDGYEEIASNTSRPSAMELIIPAPNGHGQYRSLWCEVEEVKNSGILETLSPGKQRLQEAIFEIITSEASYYKSLSVLDKIFASNPLLRDGSILCKSDWKILFGNVTAVRKCSEKLLASLEKCWQDSILLTGLCDVIYQHASENFKIYVKYCSNQIYIDRTLKTLKEQNTRFVEIISQLEANPLCHSLSLHSFLMLPMQRITRMPLLIDAVLSKMDPLIDSSEYKMYQMSLFTLNKVVKECNEAARKLERYEEMLLLSGQLEFSRKDVKTFSVASSSRWLIRSGPMVHINLQDIKLTFTRKLTKQTTKFYFFLFNDILVVAKKKSDETYVVFDYCARNMLQMNPLDENYVNPYKYLLMLTILENHEGKTVEMILSCDSDSTRQRWLEATSCHLTSDNPDEKLYEEWDCPQVSAVHTYTAMQPDELSLQAGDVVKVLKKTTDGWYHGERIRDGVTGWFPGNYTTEIASQHMRAKNLRLRHRLLTLSGNYLQFQQQKRS